MKIAFVHIKHSGTGGNEKYLNDASYYLAEQGHEVTIICRRHEAAHHKNIKFVKLKSFSLGPAHRSWSFAKAADKYVREHQFDVVIGLGKTYSQDILRLGAGLIESYHEAAHKYSRSPTQIALGRDWLKNKVELALERKAFKKGNYKHIIANSQMVADDVKRRYGVPDNKISVIYNGVDTTRFSTENRKKYGEKTRKEFGISEADKVVLFLGTNYGLKGLDRALNSLKLVVEKDKQIKLLIVGYGKRTEEFKAITRSLGLAENVIFAGGRRDPEAFYSASDIFLLPTRYDPFANATLEALASGLPVITSKKNGGHELLLDNDSAWVLNDADDPAEVSRAINHFLQTNNSDEISLKAVTLAKQNQIASKMAQLSSLVDQIT